MSFRAILSVVAAALIAASAPALRVGGGGDGGARMAGVAAADGRAPSDGVAGRSAEQVADFGRTRTQARAQAQSTDEQPFVRSAASSEIDAALRVRRGPDRRPGSGSKGPASSSLAAGTETATALRSPVATAARDGVNLASVYRIPLCSRSPRGPPAPSVPEV